MRVWAASGAAPSSRQQAMRTGTVNARMMPRRAAVSSATTAAAAAGVGPAFSLSGPAGACQPAHAHAKSSRLAARPLTRHAHPSTGASRHALPATSRLAFPRRGPHRSDRCPRRCDPAGHLRRGLRTGAAGRTPAGLVASHGAPDAGGPGPVRPGRRGRRRQAPRRVDRAHRRRPRHAPGKGRGGHPPGRPARCRHRPATLGGRGVALVRAHVAARRRRRDGGARRRSRLEPGRRAGPSWSPTGARNRTAARCGWP